MYDDALVRRSRAQATPTFFLQPRSSNLTLVDVAFLTDVSQPVVVERYLVTVILYVESFYQKVMLFHKDLFLTTTAQLFLLKSPYEVDCII
jgi:hypothetical protein